MFKNWNSPQNLEITNEGEWAELYSKIYKERSTKGITNADR